MIDSQLTQRQIQLLEAMALPVQLPELDREQLLAAMQHDKKVEHGRLRFVLPTRLGHVEVIRDVDPIAVRRALDESMAR
jgi:3-dehydroquinate synthase